MSIHLRPRFGEGNTFSPVGTKGTQFGEGKAFLLVGAEGTGFGQGNAFIVEAREHSLGRVRPAS